MSFNKGDRVMSPGGKGTIQWRRMKAPYYDEVAVYSVRLDNGVYSHADQGSMYAAKDVHPEEKKE